MKPFYHSMYYLVCATITLLVGFTTVPYLFGGCAVFFMGVQMIVDEIKKTRCKMNELHCPKCNELTIDLATKASDYKDGDVFSHFCYGCKEEFNVIKDDDGYLSVFEVEDFQFDEKIDEEDD